MQHALIFWGGWEGHEPEACVNRFLPFLEKQGFELSVHNTLAVLDDAATVAEADLIVPCWTMGQLSEAQEKHLLDAVRNGSGIAGWHGGMGDAFRNNTGYQFMVGGQFVEHPGGIRPYTVHIEAPDHPATAGLPDFDMNSELYYMHFDPTNRILASTRVPGDPFPWVEGAIMPVAWTRPYGQGRVFYSALGHLASDFDAPECRMLVERGMLWAARDHDLTVED